MKKYIIAIGGGFKNKGAQALTFTLASEAHKKWPQYSMVMISDEKLKDGLVNFDIIPHRVWKKCLILRCLKLVRFYKKDKKIEFCNSVIENSACLFDISGFFISSQWKTKTVLKSFMGHIAMPIINGVDVYLMPQSFGPFDFNGICSIPLAWALKIFLPRCKCIIAREKTGENLLISRFHLNNVVRTPDLVLQCQSIGLKEAFKTVPAPVKIDVSGEAVALIPNRKNEKYLSEEEICRMYGKIIDHILQLRKTVYLVWHENGDYAICDMIKGLYAADNRVVLVDEELSCFDYCDFVSKMDFIIASRYHSIVNAYRMGVPAIIIGWADKYNELAEMFKQEGFQFDSRTNFDAEKLLAAIDCMAERHSVEAEQIRSKLSEIQNHSVFDYIGANINE